MILIALKYSHSELLPSRGLDFVRIFMAVYFEGQSVRELYLFLLDVPEQVTSAKKSYNFRPVHRVTMSVLQGYKCVYFFTAS